MERALEGDERNGGGLFKGPSLWFFARKMRRDGGHILKGTGTAAKTGETHDGVSRFEIRDVLPDGLNYAGCVNA